MRVPYLALGPAFAVLALLPGPAAAPRTPLTAFRTRLSAEPNRDWTVVWTRDGGLDPINWKIGGRPITPFAVSAAEADYDYGYYGGASLPADSGNGRIKLDAGPGYQIDLTVVPPPARTRVDLPAGSPYTAFRRAAVVGNTEIVLAPGEYVWDLEADGTPPAQLAAGTIVRGYGAFVRRTFRNNYGGNWPILYLNGDDVSVYGVTFVYDGYPGMVFACNTSGWQPGGLVVRDCTFTRCDLGFYLGDQFLAEDCIFEHCGAGNAPSGAYVRCTFRGKPISHAFKYDQRKPLLQVDNVYDLTDRGRNYNTAGGPVSNCLFIGTVHRDINGNQQNAGECDAFEGNGDFDDNLFFHERFFRCSGPTYSWGGNADGRARRNYIKDLIIDGGMGALWWGREVTDNVVEFAELHRAGWYMGPGCARNRMVGCFVVGWRPTRGNSLFPQAGPFGQRRRVALWAEGPNAVTNVLTGVDVTDTMAGAADSLGFARP